MSRPISETQPGGIVSRRILPALNRLAMRLLGQSVILKGFLYRIWWLFPETLREQNLIRTTLKSLAQRNEPIFFINIGANDGLAGDPLREFIVTRKWSGILVEPVDYVFQRLTKAYRAFPPSRIKLENAAIAEITGTKKFWHLKQTGGLPPGYDQIGSFDKSHVLKHRDMFPTLENYLVSKEIPCITFADLLRKHGGQIPDLVFIDTEGFDYEVIKQIDLKTNPPKIIIFENAHLSKDDHKSCNELLRTNGYEIAEEDCNTVATRAHERVMK
jgi:FkbM family methyltransferase